MSEGALEIVTFKTKPGVALNELLKANEGFNQLLDSLAGFQYRSLTYDKQQDEFVDVVYWQSMEHAHQAAENAMQAPAAQTMMALIDMASTKMRHADILSVVNSCETETA